MALKRKKVQRSNIIIFGPQGAGKGTQAKLLAQRLDLVHIEPGRLLRDIVRRGGKVAKGINDYLVRGALVPTDFLLEKVLKPKISVAVEKEKGLIFDGAPRRLNEALMLEGLLRELGREITHVFYLKIRKEESYRRLGKRLTCRQCKRPLILRIDVDTPNQKCPYCRGELYQRADDTRKGIKRRLSIFKKETLPVIEFYRQKGILIEIDGEQLISKVHLDIVKKIEKVSR